MEKHRCKVCRKSFPSGRSLGGHMRSHVTSNSLLDDKERAQQSNRSSATLGASYGLREKPERTRRYDWEESISKHEKECKECGKCFPSWKALFGHMKCHSERSHRAVKQDLEQERKLQQVVEEQEGSWSVRAWRMGLESTFSDDEVSGLVVPRRKRRSRRVATVPGSSSSVSEYEPEQEDVAITLMMLSRDVGNWRITGSHSLAESSDKNSMVLEHQVITEEGDGFGLGKAKKLGEKMIVKNGSSMNGPKKLEPDASDDGLEFKKPKSYASDTDDESKKGFSKKRSVNYGLAGSGKKPEFDGSDSEVGNYALKYKRERFDAFDPGLGAGKHAAWYGSDSSEGFLTKAPQKRTLFECTTCNKTFHSYQALGGHRTSHKRFKGCPGSSTAAGSENSVETEASFDRAPALEEVIEREASNGSSKQNNRHECLICGKVFSSGQALGGHKRSHVVAGADGMSDASGQKTIVVHQQSVAIPDLLDLNLPAPVDEESGNAMGSLEFKPWWAGSGIKHEPLGGLISNS